MNILKLIIILVRSSLIDSNRTSTNAIAIKNTVKKK